jgi:hypothetical protein
MTFEELAPLVQKTFQTGLDKSKSKFGKPVNASGSLRKSIKISPIKDGLLATMNPYGLYINEGTRRSKYAGEVRKDAGGRSKMIESLLVWIDAKKITPRFGTKLGLAFALRNSIWKKGITPNHWLDNVLDEMLEDDSPLVQYLLETEAQDIEDEIIKIFESIQGI